MITTTYKGVQVASPVSQITSDYTLGVTDSGSQIHNEGATGTVTFTLPPATVGLSFDVANVAVLQKLILQASGTDYFQAIQWKSAAGGTTSFTTTTLNMAAYAKIQCFVAGVWHVVMNFGFVTP